MTVFAYGWANSVTPGAVKPPSLQARLAELAPPAATERSGSAL
jgi:hypothetical protein